MHFHVPYVVVTVQFAESEVQVNENDGLVEICIRKNLETTIDLTLDLAFRDGNAIGNQIQHCLKHTHINYTSPLLISSSGIGLQSSYLQHYYIGTAIFRLLYCGNHP